VLCLSNGHIAVSGSSQNNKLVICEYKRREIKIVKELSDHISTITGLIEIDGKLISCGIDKNILVYEIKEN
jgi:hypothetical protein